MDAPIPDNEQLRLAALEECDVPSHEPGGALQAAAALASSLCATPIALVSLVREDHQVFVARVGLDAASTPRRQSFCAWAILGSEPFIVRDSHEDARFRNNELVTGPPHIRFYAGFPLITSDGLALGSLCVIDREPRTLSELQLSQMRMLATQVAAQLDLCRWRTRFSGALREVEHEMEVATSAQRELRFQQRALDEHAGVVVTDSHGVVTYVNDRFCALTGWTRSGATGRPGEELWSTGAGTDTLPWRPSREQVWHGEMQGHGPTGREYWVDLTVLPCLDADGAATRHVAVCTDITDRKEAERRLAEVEARASLIIDGAMDAIITIDERGVVTGWNTRATATFGYEPAEAIGRTLADLIIPMDQQVAHLKGLERFAQTGKGTMTGRRVELMALHRSGREFPVEMSLTALRQSGKLFVSAFIRDITERQRVSAELRRARDDAEAAARAKAEFLANMSHEIRTPLTAVLGFTELLAEDPDYAADPSRRAEAVGTIRRNGEQLLAIINDVLDLSKIEAGKMSVERVRMDLRALVSEVAELFGARARQKGLTLDAEFAPRVPAAIMSDPVRLRQVLTNLVANAIKFTSRGGVKVRVDAQARVGSRCDITISVEDTGVGIPREHMEHLFGAFWQGDASMTRRFGGTGLGLRICKSLMELLSGDIRVDSAPGRGSVFTVRLHAEVAEAPPAPADAASPSPLDAHRLAGVRILLAEDGVDNQRLISHHLRRAGAVVQLATNGREAVAAVLTPPSPDAPAFDLVIMDMQMPEMDGYTAVRTLRSRGVSTPVLALTAHAMQSDRERCLACGCDDFATKPIERATLLQACANLAARPAPARGPSSPA